MRIKKKIYFLFLLIISSFFSSNVIADDLILSGQLSGSYLSDSNIYTQGTCTVEPSTSAILEAPNRIVLYPGFHAKANSTFSAKIGESLDSDGDGLPDAWELDRFGHLNWGPGDDPDYDGLLNIDEYMNNTDPNNPDSDNDGMPDGWEILNGLNPLLNDAGGDLDSDGYLNYVEYVGGTDPDNDAETPNPGIYYVFDKLGRLIKSAHISGSQIEYEIEYSYDSVGNRTSKIVN